MKKKYLFLHWIWWVYFFEISLDLAPQKNLTVKITILLKINFTGINQKNAMVFSCLLRKQIPLN